MSALGLVINASYPETTPSPAQWAELGFGPGSYARTIVQGSLRPTLDRARASLEPAGMKLALTINNECTEVRGDWGGLDAVCWIVADEYSVLVEWVEVGNELDLWQERGDTSLTPAHAAFLTAIASDILRPAGIKVTPTSLASEHWPEYLRQLAPMVRGRCDAVNLHLYAKSAGGVPAHAGWQDFAAALEQAHQIAGMPVISTEAGIKEVDAGGKQQQAKWVRNFLSASKTLDLVRFPLLCLFAWSDRIGTTDEQGSSSFGLLSAAGRREPAWHVAQTAMGGPLALPEPLPIPTTPAPAPPLPEPAPEPEPAPATHWVGPGVRAAIDAHGWTALSEERYVATGTSVTLVATDDGPAELHYWDTTGRVYVVGLVPV